MGDGADKGGTGKGAWQLGSRDVQNEREGWEGQAESLRKAREAQRHTEEMTDFVQREQLRDIQNSLTSETSPQSTLSEQTARLLR